ncbi:ADP-heptose synthase [Deferribacter desulfuricans SSM1]|uniref:ADP-heptose synthase n=1 Tax=Deferribacter desulfuricans (strain DSM 14783 / JCM 11476 / NBRC 101012 / SSM1) TaxID=639282 RepID=D3PBN2_DEFDS|nr:D-glycero-beta-D-manno-heptose-7-phosphate kinase [Deferribacter desulfuricans]BAI80005.1 ADP-heptose synthase [Deferribacter desulfuricans SSM1]
MNTDLNRLTSYINKFDKLKILVIGDLMLDIFIYGSVDRISPEAPVPVVEIKKEVMMPGGAANVAANLKALGVTPILAGIIGNDNNGSLLKNLLNEMQIDNQFIIDDGRTTSTKTRVVAHSQQVVRIDKEEKHKIKKKDTDKLLSFIEDIKNSIDAIIISDYGKGMITKYLIEQLVANFSEKIITVDPKIENFYYYKNVTSLTPNNKEASTATNIKITDEESLTKCGKHILEKLKSKSLVITRGEEGMTIFTEENITHIPAVAKEVFDVTGAGDTVISVFTSALAVGASYTDAAIIANAAAGIVVGKVGTATTDRDELLKQIPNLINSTKEI